MSRTWATLRDADWPAPDRQAWEAVLRDGDLLDGRGAGAHWSTATRTTNRKHYARWLGWLAAEGMLDPGASPESRVTPERVQGYARALMSSVAPKTVDSYLRDLKVVIRAMAPDRDWRWLMDLANRVKSWARPSRDRAQDLPAAREMFATLLGELDRLAASGPGRRAEHLDYRDALLVGFLLAGAPRLRNLAMIRIGTHLQEVGSEWHLRFASSETKNRWPLHLVLPAAMNGHIARYIDDVRPRIPGAGATDRLWPACKGRPMAHHTVYDRVRRTTERLFGVAINPHSFRTVSATLLAETSPADALRARPLLGHRSAKTTEEHYVRACQIGASRRVTTALRSATRD